MLKLWIGLGLAVLGQILLEVAEVMLEENLSPGGR